jgi:hypothetical protein
MNSSRAVLASSCRLRFFRQELFHHQCVCDSQLHVRMVSLVGFKWRAQQLTASDMGHRFEFRAISALFKLPPSLRKGQSLTWLRSGAQRPVESIGIAPPPIAARAPWARADNAAEARAPGRPTISSKR